MSYVENNLILGEKVVYKTGIHWSALFWPFLFSAALIAGGIACFVWKPFAGYVEIGSLLISVAAVLILYAVMQRNSTEIAVTNKRVIIKTGMAARRSLEIMLPKVESIGITETVWGRILGFGTVVIHGTGGTPEPFSRIAHPSLFRQRVQEQADSSLS